MSEGNIIMMQSNINARFVFDPVYSALGKLSQCTQKPWVAVKEDSRKITRVVAPIANAVQKGLIYAAMAVATLALGLFSLLALPYRYYNRYKMLTMDVLQLPEAEKSALKAEITKYVNAHGKSESGKSLTEQEKKDYVFTIMVAYARSKMVYGPVARAWTEYLLDKANKGNSKLIFLARDGIPQYKMAKKLMATKEYQEKYPNLVKDDQIVLGYISRKVKDSTKGPEKEQLFKDYIEKELGIKKGDKCLFADVGYAGSLIDFIKSKVPGANFEYVISLSDQATGFVTEINRSKYPIEWAGGNPGAHWLEDAHQGNFKSPTELVKASDGRIYPITVQPNKKEYITVPGSLEYMGRKFSQRAIVRCHKDKPIANEALAAAKAKFIDTMDRIKRFELPLFTIHK